MSLHGAYDPDNIFARILRGDIPSVKVWEDDHVLAFMDVFPQSEGHVLVISKTSTARTVLEIAADDLARVTEAVRRTARAVDKALNPEGISLMQFNGDAGGQTVFHLHVHIVPRWADRPMKGHGHAPMAETATLQALADRIRAALEPA
ncbi:MAG TPA: HIT family protein [Brevundimonas sp.]|mgnify:CR=1 FL=1|uniref:HIT family protein n=1 Tax=Brevundimonas sp. TaxID=1871086 RepID=UPI0026128FC1|nr:HIT family protein [Brevundimonas sp.]HRO33431.1 HIT family protein [Brevundimonas sp.]